MKKNILKNLVKNLVVKNAAYALALSLAGALPLIHVGNSIAAPSTRPLLGDVVHGAKLYDSAARGKAVRVDGAWINSYTDEQMVRMLEEGKGGFPQVDSENPLDWYDVLAYIRAKNTDLRDVSSDADHVMVTEPEFDDAALQRLAEQAKIAEEEIPDDMKVFSLYKLGSKSNGLTWVSPKDSKKRDTLKRKLKDGYVVFIKLNGLREGGYEATIAVDKDIHIRQIIVRAPDGSLPDDLNQAAARYAGKGNRGKYEALRPGGAGKAVSELEQPLSKAFLMAMEGVYMFEVAEREYFTFED